VEENDDFFGSFGLKWRVSSEKNVVKGPDVLKVTA
jgi:hypothetical protein